MKHPRFIITTLSAQDAELLIAMLVNAGVEAFEETKEGCIAYLFDETDIVAFESDLSELQSKYSFQYKKENLPRQNWNAIWEANFKAIQVNSFCGIRADFHPRMENIDYEIIINPKMAFGTGHHATTFMMISEMEKQLFQNAKVLDFGCGTGILSILASMMGAKNIDAVDIEQDAVENTLENCSINKIDNVEVIHGDLAAITGSGYDVILANINRNVILKTLPALYQKLKNNSILLISGILDVDLPLVQAKAEKIGFCVLNILNKGEWIYFELKK